MVVALILLRTKAGKEREIVSTLLDKENIKEAHIVYGQYDVVVKVEVEDHAQLQDFIISEIRPIDGIEQTATLLSVD